MISSKTVALILGPTLTMGFLIAGYWFKTHQQEPGAPMELHALLAPPPPPGKLAPSSPIVSSGPVAPASPTAPSPSSGTVSPDISQAGAPAPVAENAAPAPTAETTPPAATPTTSAAIVPAPSPLPPPKFDVVRVEPSGEAVIAGHTEPDKQVAVVSNGQVIAEGKSDANGQFVLLPKALPPGEHSLALQVTPPSGPAVVSNQNVAVSVPLKGKGDVMVALAEPGKATVLLADPTAKAAEAQADAPKPPASPAKPPDDSKAAVPSAKPDVAIKTAEIVEPGGFFASGTALPGAHVRFYLNGSALADVKAGQDGHWAVKIGEGLVPGHYAVRADQLDKSGRVVARAEVPFDYAPLAKLKDDKSKEAEAHSVTPPAAAAPSVSSNAAPPSTAAAPPQAMPTPEKNHDQQKAASAAQDHPSTGANDAAKGSVASEANGVNGQGQAAAVTPNAASKSDVAAAIAPPQKEASQVTGAPESSSAMAIVPKIQTATVEKGNNLWRISRETLGQGVRYTEIYAANATQIRDPKLIYPGQVFVIPGELN